MRGSHPAVLTPAHSFSYKAGQFEKSRDPLERLMHGIGGFLTHPADAMTRSQRSMMVKNVGFAYSQAARLAEREGRLEEAIDYVVCQQRLCQAFVDELATDAFDPIRRISSLPNCMPPRCCCRWGGIRRLWLAMNVPRARQLFYTKRPNVFDSRYLKAGVHWMRSDIARKQGDNANARSRLKEIITILELMDVEACVAGCGHHNDHGHKGVLQALPAVNADSHDVVHVRSCPFPTYPKPSV